MTTVRTFVLPDLGEGLTEAEIVRWHVAVGDEITLNQVIAEVETEKAVVELPSPYAGTVVELIAPQGTSPAVGSPIIAISVDQMDEIPGQPDEERVPVLVGYGPSQAPPSRRRRSRHRGADQPNSTPVPPATPPATEAEPAQLSHPEAEPDQLSHPKAKPPVRYLARQLGVELAEVPGSGPAGLITRDDVLSHVAGPAPAAPGAPAPHPVDEDESETRVPIRGVRKLTAEAMVRSAFTAPHVTEFVTVDVTPMMELLERLSSSPVFDGLRVTPLTLVAKALLLALGECPNLNASWDEAAQEIVVKHYVHLGIAAATPRGLVVPSIKHAERLTLRQLAQALADLTETARQGRSSPADLTGGTITITNIGVFGIDSGTPIINPGEAAILCVGAIRRQPWEFQGEIALRSLCTLSLSFDHRMVDGEEGSRFLGGIARTLADPTYFLALS
jgi:pyruvate dehydrogenase E2 component (dihydrolipoamide acetyltransferase)